VRRVAGGISPPSHTHARKRVVARRDVTNPATFPELSCRAMNPGPRMHLLGAVCNFVRQPPTNPLEASHQQGLVFVAMDARDYATFRGGTPTGEWTVARKIQAELPLDPWPDTGWRFDNEAAARNAYQLMRNHIQARLAGVQSQDDRGPERRLNDPASAWGEAFHWQGREVLYLSCDLATQAQILEGTTQGLEAMQSSRGGPRYASYNTQVAPHAVAIATGEGGLAEHVLVAFSPAQEGQLIAAALPGSVNDTKPFPLDVPSGILVVAWARIDGGAMCGSEAAQGQDPAAVIANLIGSRVAGPLPSPLDAGAPGPLAWGIRVRPGKYGCALRFLETEQGISAMALSHDEVVPMWADMGGGKVKLLDQAAIQSLATAAQAAQAQIASGGGGDPDPVVFPGQPLARLSDYVRLMKSMSSGDMNGALQRAGLDMASYGAAASAWGMKMASDPTVTAKFAAMMAQP